MLQQQALHDWCNFIKSVYRKNPLDVIEMSQNDFLNFATVLNSSLVHRKKNEEGEMIRRLKIKFMKFERNHFQFFYNTSFDNLGFKKVDLRRGSTRNRNQNINIQLKPLNSNTLPIAKAKFYNLHELFPYVSDYNKPFYLNLKASADMDAENIYVPISDD